MESEMDRGRRELTAEKEKRHWLEGRVKELETATEEWKRRVSEQCIKLKGVGRKKRRAKKKDKNAKGNKRI